MTLRVGSCFSGIGGLDLGLERTGGFRTVWFIENDPHCQKVLRRHWPDVPVFGDIHEVEAKMLADVDIMVGGYPCQPFSVAGDREGENDARHLWPQMRRLLRLQRPRHVLLENVPGHLSLGFGDVLSDLDELRYDAEWGVVSAAGSCGAPHLRRRLFVVAHSNSQGRGERAQPDSEPDAGEQPSPRRGDAVRCDQDVADASSRVLRDEPRRRDGSSGPGARVSRDDRAQGGRVTKPGLGLRPDGVPYRLGEARWPAPPGHPQHDWEPPRTCEGYPGRVSELKALGNAVVPQVAEYIGHRILEGLERADAVPT